MTWQPNLLSNYTFEDSTSGWTLDTIATRDIDEILENNISINLFSEGKLLDSPEGLISDKLLVRPTEIYSASIFCRTSDYTLFDGANPQIEVELLGYETTSGASTQLGYASVNNAEFPAQDWFRIKIEDITIPDNIHYISLRTTMQRNGNAWINYPCIEYGDTVTDYNPYNTDLMAYYNKNVYSDILEIQQLVKTQNIEFDRLNRLTEKTSNNFYIFTCDLDGILKFEQQLGILANPTLEDIDFRRARILNRFSILIPYTFPFLMNKLDELLGIGNWDAYIDFANYTLYIEYSASASYWNTEISVTVHSIKPANIVFVNIPRTTHAIGINEEISNYEPTYNYRLDGSWLLGEKPFVSLEDIGILKMPTTPSVQTEFIDQIREFCVNDVAKVTLNDTYDITVFDIKNTTTGEIGCIVPLSSGLTEITNIKLLDISDNVLTNSTVYVQLTNDQLFKHKIAISEVLS